MCVCVRARARARALTSICFVCLLFFCLGEGVGGGGGGLPITLVDDGSAFWRFHSREVGLVQDGMRFSAVRSVRARESPQALLCSLLP